MQIYVFVMMTLMVVMMVVLQPALPGILQAIPEEAEYRKVITQVATYRIKKAEEISDVSSGSSSEQWSWS